MIRVDNGPEFISLSGDRTSPLEAWCRERGVVLACFQPGSPTQNAYIERLNGRLRRELLNAYVFRTLDEVRQNPGEWQHDYNHRPHKSLGYRRPVEVHR